MGRAENQIQKTIIQYLKLRNYFFWRQNNTPVYDVKRGTYRSFTGTKGLPDIIVLSNPMIFIECKSKNGKQTMEQKIFQNQAEMQGHIYVVAKNLQDVINVLH